MPPNVYGWESGLEVTNRNLEAMRKIVAQGWRVTSGVRVEAQGFSLNARQAGLGESCEKLCQPGLEHATPVCVHPHCA